MTFRLHMKQEAMRLLEAFPEESKPEIYVIAMEIYRVEQDARYPYLSLGYNTESQIRREQEAAGGTLDPAGEVRWSYAYWILEGFERIGHVPEDPRGTALHLAEATRLGLWWDDQEELPDEKWSANFEQLERHFSDVCLDVARHLHGSGRVAEVLGRPVPIVLFDMDDPEAQLDLTEAANPPELVADYLAWHRAQLE